MLQTQKGRNGFVVKSASAYLLAFGELLGKTFVVGDNNLSWTILKNEENVINIKTTRKLNQAITVMHEFFQSVKEP